MGQGPYSHVPAEQVPPVTGPQEAPDCEQVPEIVPHCGVGPQVPQQVSGVAQLPLQQIVPPVQPPQTPQAITFTGTAYPIAANNLAAIAHTIATASGTSAAALIVTTANNLTGTAYPIAANNLAAIAHTIATASGTSAAAFIVTTANNLTGTAYPIAANNLTGTAYPIAANNLAAIAHTIATASGTSATALIIAAGWRIASPRRTTSFRCDIREHAVAEPPQTPQASLLGPPVQEQTSLPVVQVSVPVQPVEVFRQLLPRVHSGVPPQTPQASRVEQVPLEVQQAPVELGQQTVPLKQATPEEHVQEPLL